MLLIFLTLFKMKLLMRIFRAWRSWTLSRRHCPQPHSTYAVGVRGRHGRQWEWRDIPTAIRERSLPQRYYSWSIEYARCLSARSCRRTWLCHRDCKCYGLFYSLLLHSHYLVIEDIIKCKQKLYAPMFSAHAACLCVHIYCQRGKLKYHSRSDNNRNRHK